MTRSPPPPCPRLGRPPARSGAPEVPGATFLEIERHAILSTYEACGQNVTRTAEVLGLSPRTIHYRLREYRGALELPPGTPVALAGGLDEPDTPSLETLLALLPRRADVAGALLAVRSAEADARLQERLGVPLPRLALQGGRENEYFAQGDLEVPLPIYQRNQTGAAVATARVATRRVERSAARSQAEAELRAAYAGYEGTRVALATLHAADDAVVLTERLATRAYELGQRDLASVLLARRTAAEALQRRLETLVARARALIAVDQAAGRLR